MTPATPEPPKLAVAILSRLLPPTLRSEMLGDLSESFRRLCQERGVWRARLFYWRQLASLDIWRLRWEAGGALETSRAGSIGSQGLTAGAMQDVKYAGRSLWRSRGFATAAILTLGLGIGANSAIFSIVNAVLLTPLPYASPDRLMLLWHRLSNAGMARAPIPSIDVLDYQRETAVFDGFAATDNIDAATLEVNDRAMLVKRAPVTPNFFALLGVAPAMGETFSPDPAMLEPADGGAGRQVVLSNALWQRAFGGDSSVVGRSAIVNGAAVTVLGVLPTNFRLWLPPEVGFPADVDLWSVLSVDDTRGVRDGQRIRDEDSDDTGVVIGRLSPNVTVGRAQAEMDGVAARQRQRFQYYESAGIQIDVVPMQRDVVAGTRIIVLALFGAVGIVLLIACLNVATLIMARASHRRSELAVRSALGASMGRIARQLFTESAMLALLGGACGVVLARMAINVLLAMRPADLLVIDRVSVNTTVLVFTLGVTTLAALVFGAVPALDAIRHGHEGALLGRPRGGGRRGRSQATTGNVLVVGQVALSLTLLVGAGLLLRSLEAMAHVAPGFDPTDVLAFDVTLRNPERHRGPAARSAYLGHLVDQVSALPGVADAAVTSHLPLDGRTWTNQYGLAGQPQQEWSANEANFFMVTAHYFAVMQTTVLAGRLFTSFDDRQDRRVVIIDRKLAERLTEDGRPLTAAVGQTVGFPLDGDPVQAEVVGIVEDMRYEDLRVRGRETLYVPYRHEASRDVSVVVRTNGTDPRLLPPSIETVMRRLDPHTPPNRFRALTDHVDTALATTRFSLVVFTTFAVLALILATVGLYGVISYGVRRRMSEFGIRMALGGKSGRVIRDVLKEGVGLALTGVVLGLGGAVIGGRVLRRLVYGVRPTDPLTLLAIATLVIAVAVLACYFPAREAAHADPITVLRT